MEPYYEEEMPIINGVRYPFHTFISDNKARKVNVDYHWHYYIELLFFIKGKASVSVAGTCYEVTEGDFVIINSREIHSVRTYEGIETRHIVIKFDVDVLYTNMNAVFEAKYIMPFTMSQYKVQNVFRKSELANTELNNIILDINREYLEKRYGFELAVRAKIVTLFLWIIRNWENKGIKFEVGDISKEIGIEKLQVLLDYLDSHYAENISVKKMAQMCSVSYCYFSRFFKKVMKKTFTEYLNYIRIIEAEKLLLTTEQNITEIALNTGFTNSSYFIEQFRRYKGETPKQFKIRALNRA
ncbi:AraC family transcriptional regulator [Clostridium oryzae]|uniref:Bifunctional transcriptional activator/DNA repair enzyme AdaA n=1 Tax=Clostridium oryzae TaxID=1450648 RepID=A0A1V4IU45_9CLOT|nr:AraC family transcriptional regulator [Clostridium oryzae]OPJ63542.1 bifunctional transcriptional activator/DNA repair enzyme AdaA [Clostridium oryzae]